MTILSLIMAVVSAAVSAAERPNVLVVLTDDHSVPHVGCYGNAEIRTPNLDRFAAQGMRFDRAYVTCPQCVPSRASLMTGRSPVAIQMTRFSAPLPAEVPVFPELLRAHGYFAGVAGRTYHLDGAAGNRLPPAWRRTPSSCSWATTARRCCAARARFTTWACTCRCWSAGPAGCAPAP